MIPCPEHAFREPEGTGGVIEVVLLLAGRNQIMELLRELEIRAMAERKPTATGRESDPGQESIKRV